MRFALSVGEDNPIYESTGVSEDAQIVELRSVIHIEILNAARLSENGSSVIKEMYSRRIRNALEPQNSI